LKTQSTFPFNFNSISAQAPRITSCCSSHGTKL